VYKNCLASTNLSRPGVLIVARQRSEATLVVSYISYVAHMSQEKGK
jgi:hypothetical protein